MTRNLVWRPAGFRRPTSSVSRDLQQNWAAYRAAVRQRTDVPLAVADDDIGRSLCRLNREPMTKICTGHAPQPLLQAQSQERFNRASCASKHAPRLFFALGRPGLGDLVLGPPSPSKGITMFEPSANALWAGGRPAWPAPDQHAPGFDESGFQGIAVSARLPCPPSNALSSLPEITPQATLDGGAT